MRNCSNMWQAKPTFLRQFGLLPVEMKAFLELAEIPVVFPCLFASLPTVFDYCWLFLLTHAKKVLCSKKELMLFRGRTNGSWFTADLANVADLIWWLLRGFLYLVRPYLEALSPSTEYSVTGSADGGVFYTKNIMHVPKYSRETNTISKADSLEARSKFIYMTNGAQEINVGQPMFIMDSGSPVHCTGDDSLFPDGYAVAQTDQYIFGVSGKGMRVLGVGSIRNDKFQVQDVLYVPDLNQGNIKKTIFSVNKLTKLGYRVNFDGASCYIIDNRKRTWTWKHEIVGEAHIERSQYQVDYLRIPLDRTPVPTSSEWPRLLKSLWDTGLSGWNTIIEHRAQRASAQRAEV